MANITWWATAGYYFAGEADVQRRSFRLGASLHSARGVAPGRSRNVGILDMSSVGSVIFLIFKQEFNIR